jgi:hypothetical protein
VLLFMQPAIKAQEQQEQPQLAAGTGRGTQAAEIQR